MTTPRRSRAAIIRLVGAVLAEQTDEWTEGHRFMGLELLAKARLITVDTSQHDTDRTDTARSPHNIKPDYTRWPSLTPPART